MQSIAWACFHNVKVNAGFQRVQRRMVLVFRIFVIISFCFVAAMSDIVHNIEAIHGLY